MSFDLKNILEQASLASNVFQLVGFNSDRKLFKCSGADGTFMLKQSTLVENINKGIYKVLDMDKKLIENTKERAEIKFDAI